MWKVVTLRHPSKGGLLRVDGLKLAFATGLTYNGRINVRNLFFLFFFFLLNKRLISGKVSFFRLET